MSYTRHHAIIVTSWSTDHIDRVHATAVNLFDKMVSPITESPINCFKTFIVVPDGSNEDWLESESYDEKRQQFVNFLDGYRYEDGSSPLRWALVQYGDDLLKTKVIRDSEDRKRKD